MRVAGTSLFGSNYQLLCDGKSTSIFDGHKWESVQSPETGIATITGISGNAGTHVPALLFHTTWGAVAGLQNGPLKVAAVTSKGRTLYRVTATGGFPMTIWFDTKTYFLVRTEATAMQRKIVVTYDVPKVNRPIPSNRFKR